MASGRQFDLQIKLMMIGDQAVGKTAMLVRYTEDDFKESVLPTIGIDFKVKACISPARSARCRYNAHKPHTHTRALCTADRPDRGKEGETADMGHGRTGAFSYDYASVLQGRHGHLAHIRRDQLQNTAKCAQLGPEHRGKRPADSKQDPRGQQV
mmetsp:Transcript_2119/g.5905  ORF Transcript_2119/g.5905 Transcript_2119/m.5905 type:complete len:154 (+) Transcript_2119:56-517(+)